MTLSRSDRTDRPVRPVFFPVFSSVFCAIWLVSCGASGKDFMPLPERMTRATVVGPLCDGDLCKCIEPGANPGLPEDEGVKRFQIELGPTANEMWVKVDEMVLYKSVERANDCFIVDLREGKHPMVVRARGKNGFAVGVEVSEIGKKGLYQTFSFHCGSSDPCTFDHVDEFKASLATYERGVHDPCGSTRIRALEWLTGGATDKVHPSDLQLSLVLDIYDFTPEHASGDPACKDNF